MELQSKTSLKRVEHKAYTISLMVDTNIIHLVFKKGAEIDLPTAKQIIIERHKLQDNKVYPLLVIDMGAETVSRDVLKLFSSKGCLKYTSSLALIILNKPKNLWWYAQFMMMKLTNPVPTKRFTDRKDAEFWLNRQKNLEIDRVFEGSYA